MGMVTIASLVLRPPLDVETGKSASRIPGILPALDFRSTIGLKSMDAI